MAEYPQKSYSGVKILYVSTIFRRTLVIFSALFDRILYHLIWMSHRHGPKLLFVPCELLACGVQFVHYIAAGQMGIYLAVFISFLDICFSCYLLSSFNWFLLLLLILFSFLEKNFKILMGNSVRGLLKLPILILIHWWQLDGPSQEWSQATQKELCRYHLNRLGRQGYHFEVRELAMLDGSFEFLTPGKKLCGEGWSWLIGNFAQKKIRRLA